MIEPSSTTLLHLKSFLQDANGFQQYDFALLALAQFDTQISDLGIGREETVALGCKMGVERAFRFVCKKGVAGTTQFYGKREIWRIKITLHVVYLRLQYVIHSFIEGLFWLDELTE